MFFIWANERRKNRYLVSLQLADAGDPAGIREEAIPHRSPAAEVGAVPGMSTMSTESTLNSVRPVARRLR
jgi:hypothetical protein